MREQHLTKIRREIMRLVTTEQEALELVQALAHTKWDDVFLEDMNPCQICKRLVQYHDVVHGEISGRYCRECYDTPVKRVCSRCRSDFMGHREGGYWCIQCQTSPCFLCQTPILWSQANGLKLCDTCKIQHNITPEMIKKEKQKVSSHLGRTRESDQEALTIEQWLKTLVDHNFLCAYCLVNPYDHIDHFIPVSREGKTSSANCIPACKNCNAIKHGRYPDDVTGLPQDALIRVFLYLQAR